MYNERAGVACMFLLMMFAVWEGDWLMGLMGVDVLVLLVIMLLFGKKAKATVMMPSWRLLPMSRI